MTRQLRTKSGVRDDGLAFECSCPVGSSRQFCKHAVAVTLAHFEKQAEQDLAGLRERLLSVSMRDLLDGLLQQARQDPGVLSALKLICEAAGR